MIKLLIPLLIALTSFNIPAMDAESSPAVVDANEQLQSAIAKNDIAAACVAFDNDAKFAFPASKDGTRSRRQVNALNFVLKHFIAGGESKTIASKILTKLDKKQWDALIGLEDGFTNEAPPVEELSEEMLTEVYGLIKRIHFNSDDDEEAYQKSLRDAAAVREQQQQNLFSN